MNYKQSQRKLKKRFLGMSSKTWLVVLIVLALTGLLGAERADLVNLPLLSKPDTPQTTTGNDINYGPPSKEEKKETENFKENQAGQVTQPSTQTPNPTPTSTSQKKAVTPVVGSWGQNTTTKAVEVSGYVALVESGGICTLTLKKAGQEVTESKSATPDAQTTSCGLISIARSRLAAGDWVATISYKSSTSEGTSSSITIGVE